MGILKVYYLMNLTAHLNASFLQIPTFQQVFSLFNLTVVINLITEIMKSHYFSGFQTMLIGFLRGHQEVVGTTPGYQLGLSTRPPLLHLFYILRKISA